MAMSNWLIEYSIIRQGSVTEIVSRVLGKIFKNVQFCCPGKIAMQVKHCRRLNVIQKLQHCKGAKVTRS